MLKWLQKIVGRRPKIPAPENGGDAASCPAAVGAAVEAVSFKPASIPKEWLMDQIPHEDIVSGTIYERRVNPRARRLDGIPVTENKNPRYWMLPYSATDGEGWIRIQRSIQPGDEVWTFSSTITGIKSPWHMMGVCLLREGNVLDHISEEAHFSYRKEPDRD